MSKPLIHYWLNPGRVHPEPYKIACGRQAFIITSCHRCEVTCEECLAAMMCDEIPQPPPKQFRIWKPDLIKHLADNYPSEKFTAEVLKIFEHLDRS